MILNEDYFDDLEIEDGDIIDDVEEPEPELTVEYVCDLPKHYNQVILFNVINTEISDKELITKTTLLPKIYKRLDTIFELYGIEHSEYILTSFHDMYAFETSVKFGNY